MPVQVCMSGPTFVSGASLLTGSVIVHKGVVRPPYYHIPGLLDLRYSHPLLSWDTGVHLANHTQEYKSP